MSVNIIWIGPSLCIRLSGNSKNIPYRKIFYYSAIDLSIYRLPFYIEKTKQGSMNRSIEKINRIGRIMPIETVNIVYCLINDLHFALGRIARMQDNTHKPCIVNFFHYA